MRFMLVPLLVLLTSCGADKPAGAPVTQSSALGPSSPASQSLADLYNRSCRSCHAQGAATAPRTGDYAAWQPRLEQGMDVLLEHSINGYQGMPPMGMCFDCEEENFRALIAFMATGEG
jgi:cytochrome c5